MRPLRTALVTFAASVATAVGMVSGGVVIGATWQAASTTDTVRTESVAHKGKGAGKVPLCKTEDSTGCLWDGSRRGNRKGRSFYTGPDGKQRWIVAPKGSVITPSGRIERPDRHGCLFLTYAEQGHPDAGDPGDGEEFCPR